MEPVNLEDVIKESIIEGSNYSAIRESLNQGVNEDLNNKIYDKSLSLEMKSESNDNLLDNIKLE